MRPLLMLLSLLAGHNSSGQDPIPTLRGTIQLKGAPPAVKRRQIDCPDCSRLYPDGLPREDSAFDKDGRVQWVFVHVKTGLEGKVYDLPKEPVVLQQKGCRYEPHVLGMRAGQKLVIRNGDPHPHCVHAIPFGNKEFNVGIPARLEFERSFDKPEVMIRLKEDVAVWMSAWIGVLDHPFFSVTGPDGRFEIRGLPPGKYTIEARHERCLPTTMQIELKDKESKTLDLLLELRKD